MQIEELVDAANKRAGWSAYTGLTQDYERIVIARHESGARVEIENAPLNLMRLRVFGEYGRMVSRDDAMGEWLAALERATP
jgi:hypothetical protein